VEIGVGRFVGVEMAVEVEVEVEEEVYTARRDVISCLESSFQGVVARVTSG